MHDAPAGCGRDRCTGAGRGWGGAASRVWRSHHTHSKLACGGLASCSCRKLDDRLGCGSATGLRRLHRRRSCRVSCATTLGGLHTLASAVGDASAPFADALTHCGWAILRTDPCVHKLCEGWKVLRMLQSGKRKAHRGVSCCHGRLQGMPLDSLHAVLWRPTGTAACMRTRQCQLC